MSIYPNRDCKTCAAQQKLEWGCTTKAWVPWVNLEGEYDYTCPRKPILDNPGYYSYLFDLYSYHKENIFPDPGGIKDQAWKYLKLMGIISYTLELCRKDD